MVVVWLFVTFLVDKTVERGGGMVVGRYLLLMRWLTHLNSDQVGGGERFKWHI